MDLNDFGGMAEFREALRPYFYALWLLLSGLWSLLGEFQARYPQLFSPQTLIGLAGTALAIWKWWEAREANLFRRFEEMIARNESQLVKARNDLLDVMIRPGPGLVIKQSLFVGDDLRSVLARRKWHPKSLLPIGQDLDERLEQAVRTSEIKAAAHLQRLSLFRAEIASARLIQGAVATGRAVQEDKLFKRQALELEAFDRFREVLALPGHREDPVGLELLAHQLARIEDADDQRTKGAYQRLIGVLLRLEETYSRNLALARAKHGLAILQYPIAPMAARDDLSEAISFLMRVGPPRDRHMLELARLTYLSGVTYLRLGATQKGPTQLRLAEGYYRNLIRSLRSRRGGLFRWMFETRRFTGHRTTELLVKAECGLAEVGHLLKLYEKRRILLIKTLQQGNGVRRHNRRPPPPPLLR